MELGSGIHLVPKISGANIYAVLEETHIDHLTLIDTGMPGNASRIVEFLKSLRKEQTNGFTIVLSHSDIDHSGSVAELKEKLGNVKVAIHEADAPRLTGEKPPKEVRAHRTPIQGNVSVHEAQTCDAGFSAQRWGQSRRAYCDSYTRPHAR